MATGKSVDRKPVELKCSRREARQVTLGVRSRDQTRLNVLYCLRTLHFHLTALAYKLALIRLLVAANS